MGKVFAILSGKGGTGKSTVSVGLGLSYAAKGQKVLLIDLDEGLRCLDLMTGVTEELVFDLADLLEGRPLADGIYSTALSENLFLIPAPAAENRLKIPLFQTLISVLSAEYDVIILDFAAGINRDLLSALPPDTRCLAVCNPDPVSIRGAATLSDCLVGFHREPLLILNQFIAWNFCDSGFQTIDDVVDAGGMRLIGIVSHDAALTQLSVCHTLPAKGNAARAFARIVRRLDGENVKLPRPKKI